MIVDAPVPEVAVTVTVLVPAGVPVAGGGATVPPLSPPPQPAGKPASSTKASTHNPVDSPARPPRRRRRTNTGSTGSAAANANANGGEYIETAPPSVPILSVVVTALPAGVTLAGVKVQLAFLGNPVQAKLTAALNPPEGVIVSVAFALWPAATLSEAALADIANEAGAGALPICRHAAPRSASQYWTM